MEATPDVKHASHDGVHSPVRITVVGPYMSGKSSLVRSLVRDADAVESGDEPRGGVNVFNEYMAPSGVQTKKYSLDVVFLEEADIKKDLSEYCRIMADRSIQSEDEQIDIACVAGSILRKVTAHATGPHSAINFGVYFDQLVEDSSLDEVTASMTAKALETISHCPVNPYIADSLRWETDGRLTHDSISGGSGGGEDHMDPNIIWPFIRKVKIHCKTMLDPNIVIVDCPGRISWLERQKKTMDEVIHQTDIIIETDDYRNIYRGLPYEGYYCPASDAMRMFVVTGSIVGYEGAKFKFTPGRDDTIGLDDDDRKAIADGAEETRIVMEARAECKREAVKAGAGSFPLTVHWLGTVQLLAREFRRLDDRNSKMQIRLRTKQILYMAAQKRSGLYVCHLRTHDCVFERVHKVLMVGGANLEMSDEDETRLVDYEQLLWTMRETGIPALFKQLRENVRVIRQGRIAGEVGVNRVM